MVSFPTISIRTDLPPDGPLSVRGTVVHQMSDQSPARITLSVLNEASEPIVVTTGEPAPFDGLFSEAGPSVLLLAPLFDTLGMTSDEVKPLRPDTLDGGCWRSTGPFVKKDALVRMALEPGISFGRDYVLLERSDAACFPDGEYTFNSELSADGHDDTRWTVSITVSSGQRSNSNTI